MFWKNCAACARRRHPGILDWVRRFLSIGPYIYTASGGEHHYEGKFSSGPNRSSRFFVFRENLQTEMSAVLLPCGNWSEPHPFLNLNEEDSTLRYSTGEEFDYSIDIIEWWEHLRASYPLGAKKFLDARDAEEYARKLRYGIPQNWQVWAALLLVTLEFTGGVILAIVLR